MNTEVIITCAVTGGSGADVLQKSPYVPVTPEQIAQAAVEAAHAGAAVVHIHVRDPETGAGCDDTHLYGEVVERIRADGTDVIINLTSGMGTNMVLDDTDPSKNPGVIVPEGTDLAPATERFAQVEQFRPELCTLDLPAMRSGSDYFINPEAGIRYIAQRARAIGTKPELELFDTGDIAMVKTLIAEGLLDDPPLCQICMGVPGGLPAEPRFLQVMVDALPPGTIWAAFGISRWQMPIVAQSVLMGGHVRVGLEDNLYLSRGVKATNAQLVERARTIVESLGARVVGPDEARQKLGLKSRVAA